ncbi:MAG: hypothetical protein IIB60_04355 [Planctomycetes bacterium]|nr:hypothetical protein [Planctomycetota bacterium]
MALTITNTSTLALLNILNRNVADQATTLRQLTTGKRINTGKDDPAGLIALVNINAELRAVDTSLVNNQRTDSMLTVADQAIAEISNLLGEIQTLVQATSSDANLTASEVAANQAQVDDALSAIDRIVSTTNFNGKRLIDGSFSIQTAGVTNTTVTNLRVFSRSQVTSDTILNVNRVASAQTAQATAALLAPASTTRTSGTTQLAIAGTLGTVTLTIASAQTQAQVVTTINAATGQTGVSAMVTATGIDLSSTTFGSDSFVSVEVLSGGTVNSSYGTATSDGSTANDFVAISKTAGVDANITINGQTAGTDGLNVTFSANGLSLGFTLNEAFGSGAVSSATASFTVKAAGGATFQLGTTTATRATIGVDSLATFNLGGGNGSAKLSELKAGGSVDLDSDVGGALTAVREAISEVASIRGRIGGFQKFQVGSAISSLQAAQTGLGEAASAIGDTDFAVATANLIRSQVLIQSSVQLLGVANQQAALILQLL